MEKIKNFGNYITECYMTHADENGMQVTGLKFCAPKIKKGEQVSVLFKIYKDKPTYVVEAYNDAIIDDNYGTGSFSCKIGGDMMMLAKWNGHYWIID